jgi:hypothetical protein
MRYAGHRAGKGEVSNVFEVEVGNLMTREYLEEIPEDGKIILKCMY